MRKVYCICGGIGSRSGCTSTCIEHVRDLMAGVPLDETIAGSIIDDNNDALAQAKRHLNAGARGVAAPSALCTQVGGSHYIDKGIQPIEYIHANKLDFIEGSVVKYITRWRDKNGIEDLTKIKHYIDLLIELELRENAKD